MESAYFTPEIEDFHIGYEFEYQDFNSKWHKCIYSDDKETTPNLIYMKPSLLKDYINANDIRVPYLTKEQIEAEGWKHDERYDDVKHFYTNELHLTLYIAYLKEEIIYHHISIFHGGGIMFRGECKDINTFRKICKLLGI